MTDGYEVGYDADGNVQVVAASAPEKAPEDLQMFDMSSPMTFELPSAPEKAPEAVKEIALEGGCSAGTDKMEAAARAAGKSEILDQYAADYPQGPHDKPQSMCPAFGSLRVGLRMKRTATILSGSACCVYGLSFVSHFYGARRSVGYVPFNSETLVTGKLFSDCLWCAPAVTSKADQRRAHCWY
jgi:chlorophyllide a reductase subunit Y